MNLEFERGAAAEVHNTPGGLPSIPLVHLNDGNAIPQLGFGVWQVGNDEVVKAVATAIGAGYRSIDTAQGYDNEKGVGRAIREASVDRDELFVTSKLRTRLLGEKEAVEGLKGSLKALGLDYLDMFLIHWPAPVHDRYVAAWQGLIRAREEGLVKSIGVSNFLPEHLERIIWETGVKPVVNQIETHPEFQQREIRDILKRHDIRQESYSPLGSGAALDNAVIGRIAQQHGKSPAQVIIRWHLQEWLIVIPKSVHPDRIRENLDVFDFELSDDEMAAIARLDRTPEGRTGSDPSTFNDLW
jgi:2,5-diketo-D-gluconate reductase A